MPGTVLRALHGLFHLFLLTTFEVIYDHKPHFIDKDTETQRGLMTVFHDDSKYFHMIGAFSPT